MVWGGRRLGEQLGKQLPDAQSYGESWDISDHASHASAVAGGPLAGQTLRDLMARHRRELLGAAAAAHTLFPWLVKHLDAHDWLSVQVHPDDNLVRRWWPGEGGKTEVWFVLDAAPGSKIYAGLAPGVDEAALRKALDIGRVAECLHAFEPRPGDCLFLPAGTVHAVGGGVLMAEIQQTSDATFRLYDWDRRDARGQSRTLHIEQSLACINWQQGPVRPVAAAGFRTGAADAVRQVLAECPYFHLEFRSATQPFAVGGAGRLELLIAVAGAATLGGAAATLTPGHVCLMPAATGSVDCRPKTPFSCLLCTLPS
jgi:mannose-6-phosphate isomerase